MTRRLAAAAYDTVLLAGVWFLATALLLPFTGGRAIAPGTAWFGLYLGAWTAAFFCSFWMLHGQTLGMRAWRIRLVAADGGAPTWGRCLARLAVALLSWGCLGLGIWWAWLRADRLAWHDLASGTRLERVPS